ncbi:hypothetical protein K7R09_24210 [Serratia ureilytica]|uniref:Tyrosine specific protein phosphatases domain-containing protein n=1 Tax=Serratia ureilytica TaxID=300181 RepID=A0ABU0VR08_9GAMM|nr:hypothetical protein [Serratia ureilytica]MCU7064909.1 hypothetical protein [Serratia ureilytica]MDQ1811411.1 hypothetical protein [Serratia ureilytica]MDQ1840472.1 hypothetical protein [Serratia ureilytica]MDQ1863872.1 hypothetical protein [Serratia ureilytica]
MYKNAQAKSVKPKQKTETIHQESHGATVNSQLAAQPNKQMTLAGSSKSHPIANLKVHPEMRIASMARLTKNNYSSDYRESFEILAKELKQQRVQVVISLDDEMSKLETKSEPGVSLAAMAKESFAKNGIDYVVEKPFFIRDAYAFPDNAVEDNKKIKNLYMLCQYISDARKYHRGKIIAVHCGAGDGRSGTVKSAYLIFESLGSKDNPYHEEVVKGEKIERVVTKLNDSFLPDVARSWVYPMVKASISKIRILHKDAVERTSDVAMLNAFSEYVSKKTLTTEDARSKK